MSGKSIQRTLNNAFGVVGRVLGWPFKVYRPVNWVVPLQDANYVFSTNLAASPDESFGKTPSELDEFMLYTKAPVELGDIMHSDELSKTYVVFEKNELRAVIGVAAQDRFNLLRPTFTSGADKLRGFERVIVDMPCALKIAGASSTDGALKVTTSTMSASSTQVEGWTWLPTDMMKLNDVVEIGSNRYLITFVQNTGSGTKFKATSTKVGK